MFKNPQQQALVLGGINTAGLLSLTAYTIRTLNETNSALLQIKQELEDVKSAFSENNKRSNVVFTRLNQRIEENIQTVHSHNHMLEGVRKQVKKMKVGEPPEVRLPQVKKHVEEVVSSEEEIEEEVVQPPPRRRVERVDEITSALNELMA